MTELRVEPLDEGRVVKLTIDRPARGNALTLPLLEALEAAVLGLEPGGARAAVLAGAGGKSFCTGYDVDALAGELQSAVSQPATAVPENHPLERALRAIDRSPVPIVAAVGGPAYGAGCELACACDLRVASPAARFAMPPAKLGLLYSHTGIARILGLVGVGLVKEMVFMLGAPIGAERAERAGLANRVAALADEEALAVARALAANAPLSIAGTKTIVNRFLAPPRLGDGELAEIAALRAKCFASADLGEGVAAFLEKRPPKFSGR